MAEVLGGRKCSWQVDRLKKSSGTRAQRPRRRRVLSVRVMVRMEMRGRMDLRHGTVLRGAEEEGAPGHGPDEEESPEEIEGHGVCRSRRGRGG